MDSTDNSRPDAWLEHTFETAREFLNLERREPVTPYVSASDMLEQLDLSLGEGGLSEPQAFALMRQVMERTPKSTTTRFWNQLFGGRGAVSTGADMLTSILNSSMYTYKAAGPHIQIEHELTSHMLEKIGFEEGEGIFSPGGSLSNMAAMIVARNIAQKSCRDCGHAGTSLIAYSSADAHYSIKKNAGMIGTGRENVRPVPTDSAGRMIPQALGEMIQEDIYAGNIPYIVVATAGTTVRGAFDPIDEIADVCRPHNVWLHVDGAMGGSVLLSSHKDLLDGSHKADSFTWDAHKMMGVPLLCSCILFKQQHVLLDHFDEAADYLFQSDGIDLNPGTKSIQCGRRNDAFKLWAAWKHQGDEGFRRDIDDLFTLARYAADVIKSDPDMTLTCEPESLNVCFEYTDKSSAQICEELRKQNLEIVGHATVGGRVIIRLACFNHEATTNDLDRFFDNLRSVAGKLPDASNKARVEESPACL
ncbi:MAG: pyridoxal phosphate-dependent decarboxylase family protein [Planctomycetota bacterium]|jgi:sulfinoalanine decarboxylase/sulfinoalanine decarboxylase/aspartate 1-decarboxylase